MRYAGVDSDESNKKDRRKRFGDRTEKHDGKHKRQSDLMNSTTISDLDSTQSNKSFEARSFSVNSRATSRH